MKFRLYIDEVGDPGLKSVKDPRYRYLSLTGVIMELDYVNDTVFAELERLKKKYFRSHVDEPVILHRKELVNQRYPFHSLRNEKLRKEFDNDLLHLLSTLNYSVITVVIDKLEHRTRYHVWQQDPYHYSLRVLLERYVLFLQAIDGVGDAMAESRGGKEDMRLKTSFTRVCDEGTEYVPPEKFEEYLTSRQLKVKQKSNNIAGLQLADLVAHPSHKATLARKNKQSLGLSFGATIGRILEKNKYYRSSTRRIDGWGRKWLP